MSAQNAPRPFSSPAVPQDSEEPRPSCSLREGWSVIATMRNPEKENGAREASGRRPVAAGHHRPTADRARRRTRPWPRAESTSSSTTPATGWPVRSKG